VPFSMLIYAFAPRSSIQAALPFGVLRRSGASPRSVASSYCNIKFDASSS
jgi:hypothetical protein